MLFFSLKCKLSCSLSQVNAQLQFEIRRKERHFWLTRRSESPSNSCHLGTREVQWRPQQGGVRGTDQNYLLGVGNLRRYTLEVHTQPQVISAKAKVPVRSEQAS